MSAYTHEAELAASGCPTFSHSSEVALNHTLPTFKGGLIQWHGARCGSKTHAAVFKVDL